MSLSRKLVANVAKRFAKGLFCKAWWRYSLVTMKSFLWCHFTKSWCWRDRRFVKGLFREPDEVAQFLAMKSFWLRHSREHVLWMWHDISQNIYSMKLSDVILLKLFADITHAKFVTDFILAKLVADIILAKDLFQEASWRVGGIILTKRYLVTCTFLTRSISYVFPQLIKFWRNSSFSISFFFFHLANQSMFVCFGKFMIFNNCYLLFFQTRFLTQVKMQFPAAQPNYSESTGFEPLSIEPGTWMS